MPALPADIGRPFRWLLMRAPCHPTPGLTNTSCPPRCFWPFESSKRTPRWVASSSLGGASLAINRFSMCRRGKSRVVKNSRSLLNNEFPSSSLSSPELRTEDRCASEMISMITRMDLTTFNWITARQSCLSSRKAVGVYNRWNSK
jgi:hypothetical protein